MNQVKQFNYITGGTELLSHTQPLWEKLNAYHLENAIHFKDHFRSNTFEKRKEKFITDPDTQVRVDLVKDPVTFRHVGYCISTISRDQTGEIDSLFVEPDYRSHGIGDQLMRLALDWFDSHSVKQRIIGVAEGNERLFHFYARFGFVPRQTILKQL